MADRIARTLGAPPVDAIVVDWEFNAAYGQVGWRRKRILWIGMPLFWILESQERVALIAHELAHGVNGDPLRGFFVGSAVRTLVEWHNMLQPGNIHYGGGGFTGFVLVLASPFIRLAMFLLAGIPWLGAYALAHLVWRGSQRAEYLADYLAATVSGTDAMVTMLDKLRLSDQFIATLRTITLNRSQRNLFDDFRQTVNLKSGLEISHTTDDEPEELRADATHPPTVYRIAFMRAQRVASPKIVTSPFDCEEIERELRPLQKELQEKLTDKYAASLYY
jgi:heat shock protein HtpX